MNNIPCTTQQHNTTRRKKCEMPLNELLKRRHLRLRLNTQKGDLSFFSHLETFAGETITVGHITPKFCHDFADYLIKHVHINSARTYLQKLHAVLQEAVDRNLIPYNPMPPIGKLLPRYNAPEREYLTVKEINRLKKAACPHEHTKLAFLFACYTGLRISDIETLKWNHLHVKSNATMLIKIQVKTSQEVRIPLGQEALKILNTIKQENLDSQYIFNLLSRTSICADLRAWSKAAKIDKHITFHVSRHTFATLSITAGVNLFTVSKLCGHTDIKTTQIYAKILDTTRIEAIASLDKLLTTQRNPKIHIIDPYDLLL